MRVQLNNPAQNYLDVNCAVPWIEWCREFLRYGGILHDKGLIPRESIAYIIRLDAAGQPTLPVGENVVPFKRPS